MKRSILVFLVSLFSFQLSIAQTQDDFKNEIEILMGEMQKSLQQFESLFNEDFIQSIDSLDFNSFGIDIQELEKHLEGKNLDNLSIDDMMDIMHLQMEMMEQLDFSQFNQFFEGLGISPDFPKNITPPKKDEQEQPSKKKKRKTYKL